MQLWLAFKNGPLALFRDSRTHIARYRLDAFGGLFSFLSRSYPSHVEAVIVCPCIKSPLRSSPPCPLCQTLPVAQAVEQFNTKHYIAYSVDKTRGCVFSSAGRHVVPPEVIAANDEFWSYWKIPLTEEQVLTAFRFLESQKNKPIHSRFAWNFLVPLCTAGVTLQDDPWEAEAWFCSELAASLLLVCWPEFAAQCDLDPCRFSPCILQSSLSDLLPAEAADLRGIPVPPSRRG